ncbi:MAG: class B sortase [Eggerthellaceae bacterium]|nr:class B sortase [Eggerthellaceae bacterium]
MWYIQNQASPIAGGPSKSSSTSDVVEVEEIEEGSYVDWDYWLGINPDIIGWIIVPGTNIDFPIVQAPADDPTFYLTHDVYKNYNIYGVPYLDADNAETGLLGSRNAVVYGHHMNNGSMFSTFADYSDSSFAQDNSTIYILTPEGNNIEYKVSCVQIVKGASGKITDFESYADYAVWYEEQLDNSVVVLDSDIPNTNITFVTCSYNYWANEIQGERTLVMAQPSVLLSGEWPEYAGLDDEGDSEIATLSKGDSSASQ